MPVQIGHRPLAGFNEPLEMLWDCHRRIEMFLDLLLRVTRQARGGALDDEQAQAMSRALQYFDKAAPRHAEDEEFSLFPRLRDARDPEVDDVLARLDALEGDHEWAQIVHARVDALGRRWLDAGRLTHSEYHELLTGLLDLKAMYRAHIRFEDETVFPLAKRLIAGDDLKLVGDEMAERRQVRPVEI